MSEQQYYQYAFARADCSVREIGPGVDPRFQVELVCNGPIAAMTSRVEWDRFDVERLQGETIEDIGWLKQVAIRHDEIVCQAATRSPVLPLRLGTIFRSRASLLAAVVRFRDTVTDFLLSLGDRQEWAVKVYLESHAIQETAGHANPSAPHHATSAKAGTEYMKRKKAQLQDRREVQAGLQQEIHALEQQLTAQAESCCRVPPLPATLTGRRERMVFSAAFLLRPSAAETWLTTVGRIREAVGRKGLLLEVSGPWPPYHFCPTPELSAD